jgi:hypothetical protein
MQGGEKGRGEWWRKRRGVGGCPGNLMLRLELDVSSWSGGTFRANVDPRRRAQTTTASFQVPGDHLCASSTSETRQPYCQGAYLL